MKIVNPRNNFYLLYLKYKYMVNILFSLIYMFSHETKHTFSYETEDFL